MGGLIKKAWRDLQKRKLRSLLTILGIAVGVAGIVAILSTSRNVARTQRELFISTSQADIVYWIWDAPPSLAELLEADPRIAQAELRVTFVTRWRPADADGPSPEAPWRDIELVGIDDFGAVEVNEFDLVEGRYPQMGEILVDVSASRIAGVGPGDMVAVRDQDQRERLLRVSGISRSPSYLSSTITKVALGYVPAPFLRQLLNLSGSNQLLVRLEEPTTAQAVSQRLDRLFRRQGLQAGSPQFRSLENFPGKRELDALIVIMFLFSILGLVLSSFLVVNTLSATVAEQVGEIGILKTVGSTGPQILLLYVVESLVYGALGTMLGIAGGAVIGWRLLIWIASLANTVARFRLAPAGVGLGVLVGIGVSLVGGLIPAQRGAGISIKEALESYGIQSDYGTSWFDRLLQRFSAPRPRSGGGGLPLPRGLIAMALRNLARRKGRSALTLLVVTLATAGFLGAVATRQSLNVAIDDIYTIYYADAWVWFGDQMTPQFEDLITTVDGVYTAEGWAIANGIVELAEARLWGMPADTTLYRAVIEQGRWFRADEADTVVISSELAFAQAIKVGDTVEIQVNEQRRTFRVVGIAIDNTIFLGGTLSGKAFMPRRTLTRMLGQQGRLSFFALGLASREPGLADEILARVETRFARWRPGVQPIYLEIQSAQESSRLLTVALIAMVVLIALVGALGILNTLTLNVLERRREIAVLRAVGATDTALIFSFVTEGLALGSLGWFLGLLLGYPSGRLFTQRLSAVLFALDFYLSWQAIAFSLLFTMGLTVLSSMAPALAAAHTRASAALRYE